MGKELAVIQPVVGSGLMGIREQDQMIPRIQIAAGDQAIEGSDVYIEGIKQGDIFNTLTSEIYGKEIIVVPLWYSRNRVLFVKAPGSKKAQQECKSYDGDHGGHLSPDGCDSCEYSKWGTGKDGKGFACTEFRNFAVAVVKGNSLTLASISFKNTGSPTAKKWLSMIETRQDLEAAENAGEFDLVPPLPVYRGMYKYSRAAVPGSSGVYYKPTINNAGQVPEQWVPRLQAWHDQFAKNQLTISSAEVEDETTGGQ